MKKNIIIKFLLSLLLFPFVVYALAIFYFDGLGSKPAPGLAIQNIESHLLFAHRGLLNYYPEHSSAGAKASKDLGFNAIEIDIRKSADGELIIFHDETAERMLGIDKPIDSLKIGVIKKHRLLFKNRVTDNYVITVDEFLADFKNDFLIYCDMKVNQFEDGDALVRVIKKHQAEKSCIIASASTSFIFYIEGRYPEMITALEGFDAGKEWTYSLIPKNLKPDFLSGFFQNINQKHIDWLIKNNLMSRRIVYGVDHTNYATVKKMGIRSIILDYDSVMGDFINVNELK